MKTKSMLKWTVALAICSGSALCQAQITKDLVLHLPFDNTYDNTRKNDVTATPVGSPTFAPGKIGSGAVALTTLKDGSSFNYVTLGNPASLSFGAVSDGTAVDFTVAFWCNYTNQVDDPPFISNKDWMDSNNQGWGIFTQNGGKMRINVTDDQGATGKQNTTQTPMLRDGTWHHVVVTFARATVVSIYEDGQLFSTSDMSMVKNSIDTTYPINIGQDGTGGYTDGGSAEMVDMLMDDLGIWRRALSPGEILAIYNAGLTGTNLASVPAIVDPYVSSTIPAPSSTVAPNVNISAVITDGLNALDTNSVKMLLNNTAVPVTLTKNGQQTTALYTLTNLLKFGANSVTLIFGNNASPQSLFTNTWSFQASSYITLTPDLKVTPDTSKPGFIFNIFDNQANQVTSNERTEAALAGQLVDADGNPLPNLADPSVQGVALAAGSPANPANAPIRFEIPTVINLNVVGGSTTGNFSPDDQMPGMPATDGSTDGTAAEIITYLELPAGLTTMGVNSDDGFRTATGKAQDQLNAILAGEYNAGRSPSDTVFYINVKEAGVYPFRTTWENGNGGADIEWFTVKADGAKVLVNDTANGGIKAYRATTSPVAPFVRYVSPAVVPRQLNQPSSSVVVVLADGSTAVDDASVTLKLDGNAAAANKVRQGSLVTLTYTPTTAQFPADVHQAELSFKDTAGTATVQNWSFLNLKKVILPAPAYFETFDSYDEGSIPTGWAATNYTDTVDPGLDLDNLNSDSYKGWIVVSRTRLEGLKSAIFQGPAPNQYSNNVAISSMDQLTAGNVLYAESDVRDGNQVQFIYTKPYDLSKVTNAGIAFTALYAQNQDNLGAVEYSVDGGRNWLPVVYYLDFVDSGGDIYLNADGTVDAVKTFTIANTDTASWTENGVQKGGNYGDGIAAPITQALGRFIAPRANDDQVEAKRLEIYRLEQAGGKSDVRLRFAQLGTGSWYFGVDNLGFYEVPAPPQQATPGTKVLSISAAAGAVTLSWTGGGTLLEATSIAGPWSPSPSQANPQTLTPAAQQKFYRVGP